MELMELVFAALLLAILVVVLGILTAVKTGFNEVIRGLEAVDQSSGTRKTG